MGSPTRPVHGLRRARHRHHSQRRRQGRCRGEGGGFLRPDDRSDPEFIDNDYNGECFFVRHACFLAADDPYGKLKRALRVEIDEAQWSTLYSTKNCPFDAPKSVKIALRVINHYSDEVLNFYKD